MFQEFYASVWQHPALLVVVPLASLMFLPRGSGFRNAYLWFFTVETVLDALLTSSLFVWPAGISTALGLGFVLLGDARLFFLTERILQPGKGSSWLGRGLLLTLPVPLAQAALIGLFPEIFRESRATYLAYEMLFLLWLAGYRFALSRSANSAIEARVLARRLSLYALGYYCLWALADVVILAGFDAGYLLRVVPNLLYYSLFLPFVFRTTTEELP